MLTLPRCSGDVDCPTHTLGNTEGEDLLEPRVIIKVLSYKEKKTNSECSVKRFGPQFLYTCRMGRNKKLNSGFFIFAFSVEMSRKRCDFDDNLPDYAKSSLQE